MKIYKNIITSGTIKLQMSPPIKPSIVLFGLITGHSLCFPINRPNIYAPVSVNHTIKNAKVYNVNHKNV